MCNFKECSKCSGTGFLGQFEHIEDGICYKCDGTGNVNRTSDTPVIAEFQKEFKQGIKPLIKRYVSNWIEKNYPSEVWSIPSYWSTYTIEAIGEGVTFNKNAKRYFPNIIENFKGVYSAPTYDSFMKITVIIERDTVKIFPLK